MKLKEQIEQYVPYNEQEEKDKKMILKYFETFDDVLTRENEFGHFSSSAWVLNKEKTKLLMIYHNIYDSWGWTGGHADGEEDLLSVALREVTEETGVENVKVISPEIAAIDVITVDAHVKNNKPISSHVHLNVAYILEADENEELVIKPDENNGVKWVEIKDVVGLSTENKMKVIYQKIIDKLK